MEEWKFTVGVRKCEGRGGAGRCGSKAGPVDCMCEVK